LAVDIGEGFDDLGGLTGSVTAANGDLTGMPGGASR
jgi:hypothetical protein